MCAEDLSLLLMSAFCHDCGMHITEKQFSLLISPQNTKIRSSLDVSSWPELWLDFLQDASRFNANTLRNIFGDTDPISVPPTNPLDFTDRHRLLIGEFLRLHHPRLAHDVANGLDSVLGLPTLFAPLSEQFRDLVGLISRSHGMPMRSLLPYLEEHFDLRNYNRVHIVFLMGLLRIADYAQIQALRAPRLHFLIHSVTSPISSLEWRVHQSITNITVIYTMTPRQFLSRLGPSKWLSIFVYTTGFSIYSVNWKDDMGCVWVHWGIELRQVWINLGSLLDGFEAG